MKNIYIIFLILFLDLIAFTIILPLFPSIIDFYNGQKSKSTSTSDPSLECIRHFMEWIKTTLQMPDRPRYNSVLVGGKVFNNLFFNLAFFSEFPKICLDLSFSFDWSISLFVSFFKTCNVKFDRHDLRRRI